jgi:PAS domain S-box-containing protein
MLRPRSDCRPTSDAGEPVTRGVLPGRELRDTVMPDLATAKQPYRKVVAALEESEERYRVLVEAVRRYAIFMLDPKGTIMTWNAGVRELLGYERDDIVGQSGALVFNATDRAVGAFKRELAQAKRLGESISEHAAIHKNRTEVRIHETTTAVHALDGTLMGFAKVSRAADAPHEPAADVAAGELAKALAALHLEVQHRRQLETQLLNAVEQERERLGRDLHDDLSQRLVALGMIVQTREKQVKLGSPENRKKLHELGELLSEATGVARNLSRGLHPVTLHAQGLPAALAELAARVPHHVKFSWPESARLNLEQAVALHVYRIAEEALSNSIKHAEADKVAIELQPLPRRRVALTITDNGKGFIASPLHRGMGLQNMKYRAGAIGGALKITSAAGKGTIIRCTVPVRRDSASLQA